MKLTKIRLLVTLNRKTSLLLVEAFFYLGWARILIAIPFAKIAPSLGTPMQETGFEPREVHTRTLRQIREVIRIASRHTLWESKCLVCAIAAMKMLNRRGIDSTLYLGTARDEAGGLIAHAWLRSGPFTITGAEGMERFTTVGRFASHMHD